MQCEYNDESSTISRTDPPDVIKYFTHEILQKLRSEQMSWTFHDKNPLGLEKPLWKHQDIKNATPCISTVVLVQLGSQRLSNIQRLE